MKNKNSTTQTHIKKNKKIFPKSFCFLIWVFKVEIVILLAYFIINFTLNSIPEKTKFVIKYNIENLFYNNTTQENHSIEDIFEALDKNNNLSIEEKNFIKENFKDEITENFEYIDSKLLTKRLKTLNTSYHKKYKYHNATNKYINPNQSVYLRKIGGYYNSIFNEINIYEQISITDISTTYNTDIFDFSSCNKKIYFHEFNHLMTKNTLTTLMNSFILNLENRKNNLSEVPTQINNGDIFLESTNEIFALEYFENNEEYMYNKNMIYMYVLAEILPEDVIRKYKFYDNQSILISGLLDIDNNIDQVYNLFNSINNVYKNTYTNTDFKNIHDSYSYFYEKRYNKKMSEDIEILLYLYGTNIQTEEEKTFIKNFLNMQSYDKILKIIPKGYFSKNYKNNHNKIYIEFTQKGTVVKNNL